MGFDPPPSSMEEKPVKELRSATGHFRPFFIVALLVLMPAEALLGQSTSQPTSPPGSNGISHDVLTGEYSFAFNGQPLYYYRDQNGPTFDGTGGTLAAIRAFTYDGLSTFHPSWTGGIAVEFPGYGEKTPSDAGVSFSRLRPTESTDSTVTSQWRMTYKGKTFDYQFQLRISGRTLTIRVEALNGSRMATSLAFDRCEHAVSPSIVKVPYLTLFNLLSSNKSFTSTFLDWEVTHCSEYTPIPSAMETVKGNSTSVRFGPVVRYNKMTNGLRNPLKETIFITVSPTLEGALPNLAGPVASMRAYAASKIVLNYGPPYWWAITNVQKICRDNPDNYSLLDVLQQKGVQNIAIIMSLWQKQGMHSGLPDVLPANTFKQNGRPLCGVPDCPPTASDNNALIISVRDYITDKLHFDFALYENYVDYYGDGIGYRQAHCARTPGRGFLAGFQGAPCRTPQVMKPIVAVSQVAAWSDAILGAIRPTWSYLDVHSAINPSARIDYDSTQEGAGMFLTTLQKYRQLPGILRKYGGPVQGEGGNHFLYAGYFDDFEARVQTADNAVYGEKAPLLVDFDIAKIRPKSALHGAGHYTNFYSNNVNAEKKFIMSPDQMLAYVATELAYGHAGLITKRVFGDDPVGQALLESQHVFPVSAAVLNAHPISILYGDGQTASEYIQSHPSYWNVRSADFMNRVRITYDNGVVVCVNRSGKSWEVRNVGVAGGWFMRNVAADNGPTAGPSNVTTFTLRPNSGWVCYVP